MDNETILAVKYYLGAYAEILWFRGDNEFGKGNSGRGNSLHSEYHAVHEVMKKLDAAQAQNSYAQG